jgi:hypothetical protein
MSKSLDWQKAVPAHHHALRDQYHAPADSTLNIGSCSNARPRSQHGLCCVVHFVSTHTTPTFPYILVWLCCHFRALPLEDVPGFLQLPFAIGIVPPELAQSHFQPTLSFWNPPFILEAHFVCALSIRASIKSGTRLPVSTSSTKSFRRSHSALVRHQSFMVSSCRLSS